MNSFGGQVNDKLIVTYIVAKRKEIAQRKVYFRIRFDFNPSVDFCKSSISLDGHNCITAAFFTNVSYI